MSKIGTSLENTNKLKELIVNNPELPLLIFVGEEAIRTGKEEWGAEPQKEYYILRIHEIKERKNC